MGRGPSSTKENSPHSRTWGGLMQLECAERGENKSYGETRGFQQCDLCRPVKVFAFDSLPGGGRMGDAGGK